MTEMFGSCSLKVDVETLLLRFGIWKVASRLGYEFFLKTTDNVLFFFEIFSWAIKLFHVLENSN